MQRHKPLTIDANASVREIIDAIDPAGWQRLGAKLEVIEDQLRPLSKRSRPLLLNGLLRAELDAARLVRP